MRPTNSKTRPKIKIKNSKKLPDIFLGNILIRGNLYIVVNIMLKCLRILKKINQIN